MILRQKVEKSDATYWLLVEARQWYQEENQTHEVADNLKLKALPGLKSAADHAEKCKI